MNCQTFHSLLYDYVDEALEPGVQEEARLHVERCESCRNAFLREQALASSMWRSFEHSTARLSVRAGMRRDVLKALESKPSGLRALLEAWRNLPVVRPSGMAAAAIGSLVFLTCMQFYLRPAGKGARSSAAGFARFALIINVPISSHSHVFRMEGNAVTDSVANESSVADATLYENGDPVSPKQYPRTP
jgi:hypothetical protein